MIPYCNFYLKPLSVHPWICVSRESPGKSYMHFEGLWYSMPFPCIVYSLETGGEGTLSNSFKFIRTCFKLMIHSLAEGGRWCPGLDMDVIRYGLLLHWNGSFSRYNLFHSEFGKFDYFIIWKKANLKHTENMECNFWNKLGHLSTSSPSFHLKSQSL